MRATVWQNLKQTDPRQIPTDVRPWLEKPYVLSQAIRRVSSHFSVTVINEKVDDMNEDEVEALECHHNARGWVRQTHLLGDHTPWVYARVAVPLETLEERKIGLETLGNRPIGETLLYNNETISREDFQVKKIEQDDPLLFDAVIHQHYYEVVVCRKHGEKELWARRSVFKVSEKPLLVTELFLSNLPPYLEEEAQ